MFKVFKQDPDATPEQAEWDKKARKSYIGWGVFMTLFLGSLLGVMTWAVAVYAVPGLQFIGSGLPKADPQVVAAKADMKHAMNIVFIATVMTAVLYWPLRWTARYTDWKLGSRPPKGGWKTRAVKPVDIEWEQVSDDVRIAHVGKFDVKVERFQYRSLLNRFRKPRFNYAFEVPGKINYTLTSDFFKGKTEDETEQLIRDTVSHVLEDYTDHFKELNYSI